MPCIMYSYVPYVPIPTVGPGQVVVNGYNTKQVQYIITAFGKLLHNQLQTG